jgi:hypothetical protein
MTDAASRSTPDTFSDWFDLTFDPAELRRRYEAESFRRAALGTPRSITPSAGSAATSG